jgi:hypothetical protein
MAAFDQLEYREQLTNIESDRIPVHHSRRVRCLFLYDCCRTRDHGGTFKDITLQYQPLLRESAGVRPYRILSAAAERFAAWEPTKPINLPPHHALPLSFFGHALLNAIGWSRDLSTDSELPWQTSAIGLVEDVARAMDELAKNDEAGQRLPSASPDKGSVPNFAVVRSREPPKVAVMLSCDPEAGRNAKKIHVHERVGNNNYQERLCLPPWTNHPESCSFVPGMFKVEAVAQRGTLKRTCNLRPVLSAWRWIIRDDAIDVHDPAD